MKTNTNIVLDSNSQLVFDTLLNGQFEIGEVSLEDALKGAWELNSRSSSNPEVEYYYTFEAYQPEMGEFLTHRQLIDRLNDLDTYTITKEIGVWRLSSLRENPDSYSLVRVTNTKNGREYNVE